MHQASENRRRPEGIITAAIISGCFLEAALLGAVYQIAVEFCPFVYVNVVFAVVLAVLAGRAASAAVYSARLKDTACAITIALLLAFAALAVSHYVAYYNFAGGYRLEQQTASLSASSAPLTLSAYMRKRMQTGWELEMKHSSGKLAGGGVLIVWLVEAAAVLLGAAVRALSALRRPFCYNCRDWMDEPAVLLRRPVFFPEQELARLRRANSLEELARPVSPEELELRRDVLERIYGWTEYAASACPSCDKSAYLYVSQRRFYAKPKREGKITAALSLLRLLLNTRISETEQTTDIWEEVEIERKDLLALKALAEAEPPIPQVEARLLLGAASPAPEPEIMGRSILWWAAVLVTMAAVAFVVTNTISVGRKL